MGGALKFRKKPVVIEAMQYRHNKAQADPLLAWANADGHKATWYTSAGHLTIETPEGTMIATDGDWIIKSVKGEFYPCKPDIFAETYELDFSDAAAAFADAVLGALEK